MAVIGTIRKQAGPAGQVVFTVTATHADGPDEEPTRMQLSGSVYGSPGPVVLISGSGAQTFVTRPERFGATFDEDWARNFANGEEV